MQLTKLAIILAERGLLPDALLRTGIRHLSRQRLQEIAASNCEQGADSQSTFIDMMNQSPVALVPELANEQHYEVPADFFRHCLGVHRKYSSCYWDDSTRNLDEAEARALTLSCEHASLKNGQDILELGCGWGSLSLWMAAHYPDSRIVAVSNSNSQRAYIQAQVEQRGIGNLRVITCDMNKFDPAEFVPGIAFDRIVSVEMFEHMRNYRVLFGRLHDWLKPGGRFFMHIFVHRLNPYLFEVAGDDDWMSRFFFSGGMMPSDDLPLRFQQQLRLLQLWRWDGTHYEKTANAWLANMDRHAAEINPILQATYGKQNATMWRMRWRIFYMACAELFGYHQGQEWWVSHYLFERPLASKSPTSVSQAGITEP